MVNFLKRFIFYIKYNIKQFLIFIVVDTIPFQKVKINLLRKFFKIDIGSNTVILSKVRWFNGRNLKIGKSVFVNVYTYLDDKNTIEIGDYTWIGYFVKIITATHRKENMEEIDKPVKIGKCCWIGAGAIILPGVNIGDYSIIGAGAVVTKNIPPRSIAVGNPCRIIKQRKIVTPYKSAGGYINDV